MIGSSSSTVWFVKRFNNPLCVTSIYLLGVKLLLKCVDEFLGVVLKKINTLFLDYNIIFIISLKYVSYYS